MNLPLDFHPAVRDEIDDAHDWYEQRQPGRGADFLDEIQRVLAVIAANPARYGFADADIREGLVARFPYVVYYCVLATAYACWRNSSSIPISRGVPDEMLSDARASIFSVEVPAREGLTKMLAPRRAW